MPAPGAGEAIVRHRAIGLNFIDTYHRSGLYPVALPFVPGTEASGVVQAVGEGVTELAVGDRVAYATGPLGSYSEARAIPARFLVRLPDEIEERAAAAMMLKGLTAQYLVRQCVPLKAGDTILLHAAAGGTGLFISQWAKHLGATVIGTAGSDDKARLARDHGCDHVIVYTREDFVARARELTNGRGVDVVYDGVGKDTFLRSIECLRVRGTLVSFGQASGAIPPFDVRALSKGSLYLTRPSLMTYAAERADLVRMVGELFDVVRSGAVRVEVAQTAPLGDAARAHRDLESRKTTGSTVLLPA